MAVSGKRQLEVILNYQDKLSGRAGRTVTSLRNIDKAARQAAKGVELLNKALGRGGARGPRAGRTSTELQGGLRLTRQIAAEMGRGLKLETQQTRLLAQQTRARAENVRLAREEARTSEAVARSQRAGVNTEIADMRLLRERIKLERDADRLRESRAGRRGAFLNGVGVARSGMGAVRDLYHAGRTAYDAAQTYTDPAVEQMRARAKFRLMGFPEDETAQAFSAVERVTREVTGVRQVDVQEVMTGLVNTVGTVKEAVQLLPLAAKQLATTEAITGGPEARAAAIKQFTTTAKALELLGKDQDLGEMQKYMNIVAQAGLATGGDIDADEFRDFSKYANIAAPGLTPEGLRKYLPLLSQMGGGRAGTALMTLYSNMVGGRIPSHKLRYWEELGLLDKSKVEFNKNTGKVQRLRPGAIPIAEGLGRDPVDVADKLTEVLSKHGVDVKSYDAVNKQLMSMFGDRTGAGALAQMINYRAALDKEAKNYERAAGIDEGYAQIFNGKDPLGNFVRLDAAQNDARAAAGMPVARAGGGLAAYLARALDYARGKAQENPTAAAATVGVLSLGKASAEAADGVGQFGEMLRGLRGLRGMSGTGVLGSDYTLGDAATGGYVGIRALTNLRGILAALRGPVPVTIGLTAASVFTISQISELYQTLEELKAAKAALAGANAGNLDTVGNARRQFAGEGKAVPQEIWRTQAAGALAKLNDHGQLKEALGGWTLPGAAYQALRLGNFLTGGGALMAPTEYAAGARRFSTGAAAAAFRERAPELREPEIMAEFRRMVDGWKLPADSRGKVDQALKAAFPESFTKATQLSAEELAKLQPAANSVTDALKKMLDPTAGLASGLSEAQSAALGFAARVNGLEVRPPSIVLPPTGGSGKTKSGYKLGIDPLNPFDNSAVGSVIHSDGLVNLHRGNVVMPARLSRRSPGDWLESAEAIQAAMGRRVRDDRHSPAPGQGHAEATDPAANTGMRRDEDFAGVPDYGLFAPAANVGGHVFNVQISVPAGSAAAEDPAELAQTVRAELARLAAQLAETRADLYDPRFIADMSEHELGRRRDRT